MLKTRQNRGKSSSGKHLMAKRPKNGAVIAAQHVILLTRFPNAGLYPF
jgi:hypothetical protein